MLVPATSASGLFTVGYMTNKPVPLSPFAPIGYLLMLSRRFPMRVFAILAAVIVFAQPSFAEEPVKLRFAFGANQTLTYRIVQTTTVNEIQLDENTKKPLAIATSTKLTITKKWIVKEVDPNGAATLEMTMTALKQETNQTVGTEKPVVNTLDSSLPADAKAMTFLNKPILTAKIDPLGKLLDVKSEMPGAADRLEADLPFKVQFVADAVAVNATWERSFELKLPPPLGTGEKFLATQKATYRGLKDGLAVIGVVTALKKPLAEKALLPGVAPMLWEGDVFVDAKTGTYRGAKLSVKQEVANHAGEGTKFAYASEYEEAPE